MTIEDTISWGNGFNRYDHTNNRPPDRSFDTDQHRWDFTPFEGDGNGFKLGGGDDADIGPANHVITNCFAFNNAKDGFTDNSQPGDFKLTRNTAWNNAKVGFKFGTAAATLIENVAAVNGEKATSLSDGQVSEGNSWDGSANWGNGSFVTVDSKLVKGARDADGRIASSSFLVPASGEEIGARTEWA